MNSIIPKNGLSDWAAVVFVDGPDGKTVLVFDPYKPEPVMWKLPGGKKLMGETVLQTAIRELREETGITVEEECITLIKEVDKSKHKFPHTLFVFQVSVDNFDELLEYGNEGEIVKLFEMKNIQTMKDFFPPHKAYLNINCCSLI